MEESQVVSKEELLAELKKAEESLDDLREERMFTLGQTGVHIGAARVEHLRRQWDGEEKALLEKIALLKSRLEGME